MIQINLLPDIKVEYLRSQSSKQKVTAGAVIITISALALSGLLLFYVFVIQAAQMALVDQSIKDNYAKINKVQNLDKYLTVQNQLSALPSLHDEKGSLSRLKNYLTVLNPSAPNNVRLSNVRVNTDVRTLLIQGETASFEAFNVFIDTLRNAKVEYTNEGETQSTLMFEQVSIDSSNISSDKGDDVNFSLTLTYDEVIFDAKVTGVQPKVPTIKTTQSITNSPSVFEEAGGE